MIHVKVNRFHNEIDFIFMNNFCDYVDHEQMWHLTKMFIFEFYYNLLKQWVNNNSNNANWSKLNIKRDSMMIKIVFVSIMFFLNSFICFQRFKWMLKCLSTNETWFENDLKHIFVFSSLKNHNAIVLRQNNVKN